MCSQNKLWVHNVYHRVLLGKFILLRICSFVWFAKMVEEGKKYYCNLSC